uniref:GPI mannosyltransferase 2 n=1 Tax=Panagrolaimus sp. JU765 TaxID=591449 RepID=A0AC34RJQ8_9BILA
MSKARRRLTFDNVDDEVESEVFADKNGSAQQSLADPDSQLLDQQTQPVRQMKEKQQKEVDTKNAIDDRIFDFVRKELIFSRVILIFFQFVFTKVMGEWKTDAFKGIPVDREVSVIDRIVKALVGGLGNWDSVHFMHIAEHGYTWESELAFFPLFPIVLRMVGSVFHWLLTPIGFDSAVLLAGVIINNVAFVAAGMVLLQLVHKLTDSLKQALIAVYIFCWNPASVFFSAVYTESVYSLATFTGIYLLYQKPNNRLNQMVSAVIFSFAFLTRSNGFLNLGYLGFIILLETILKRRKSGKPVFEEMDHNFSQKVIKSAFFLFAYFLIMILPLRIFGFTIEDKFCNNVANYSNTAVVEYAEKESMVLPGDLKNLEWCQNNIAIFMPKYYATVQEKYWNVGLFGYWQLRKIPLFLVAAPTLGFIFYGIVDLICDLTMDSRNWEEILTDKTMLIPFSIHSLFIACSGIFIYNVEVSIRLLYSSSPYIYIVLARIMSNQTRRIKVPDDLLVPPLPFLFNYALVRPLHFLMLTYLLGYFTIGTMMHVNWLPYV